MSNQNNHTPLSNSEFKNQVKGTFQASILSLIRRPQEAQREAPRPKNKAKLALLGFNGTMLALDLVSGITVALITSWLYGVLTFIAGVLALYLHEQLFTNAHANTSQKWIAIGGGTIAVLSTLGIGMLSGAANIFKLTDFVDLTTIELFMIGAIVLAVFTHGILWGVYYFTDPTHKAEMMRMINLGYRDQQIQGFRDAKKDLIEIKQLYAELDGMDESDREALLAAYKANRGVDLLVDEPQVQQDQAIPYPVQTPAQAYRQPETRVSVRPIQGAGGEEPELIQARSNGSHGPQANP